MKQMTKDGLLLCTLQAEAFERSADKIDSSSGIFIRRFMKSHTAELFDSEAILDTNIQPNDILKMITEEYGESDYGSVRFTRNELYWIGYIYRYFSYTYELSSTQVYRIVKPSELRALFLPYHTLSPEQAIERILEAKGLGGDEERVLKHHYEIFRRIRKGK